MSGCKVYLRVTFYILQMLATQFRIFRPLLIFYKSAKVPDLAVMQIQRASYSDIARGHIKRSLTLCKTLLFNLIIF